MQKEEKDRSIFVNQEKEEVVLDNCVLEAVSQVFHDVFTSLTENRVSTCCGHS